MIYIDGQREAISSCGKTSLPGENMIDNVLIINKHSQIRELGSDMKFRIINELILNPATCQQLAGILGMSKQKVHYNLKGLLDEGLIRIEKDLSNNKEVYYRARALNYILDFSMGKNAAGGMPSNREVLNSILQENHGIHLDYIAQKLLKDCLRLKPRERLLLSTGKYNMPLVEKLLVEAARMQIDTTLLYQHTDFIKAKNSEFSLSALTHDYERFNALLQNHDVFMNLNGESRYIPMTDPERLAIRNRGFERSREILARNHIRVAIMPGLMKETLDEVDILSEIRFWKALDIDYAKLYEATDAVSKALHNHRAVEFREQDETLRFDIDRIVCEYGSFGDSPEQSPVINLPGGKVLVLPRPGTLNGTFSARGGQAYGEHIHNLRITLQDNRIVHYTADNPGLIERAMNEGGPDGNAVALVCFNTNYNMAGGAIDTSFRHKAPGSVSLYWGENASFGGTVRGRTEWTVQLDAPDITLL